MQHHIRKHGLRKPSSGNGSARNHSILFPVLLLFILALLVLALVLIRRDLIRSRSSLTVSHYEVTSSLFTGSFRVLQLSDLHNSEFGPENERLVEAVRKEKPDLIFLTGDLVNAKEDRTDLAVHLIAKLAEIAPVYASNGNHELEYQQNYGTDLTPLYEEAGAVMLEKTWQDVDVKGQALRIGGIYGYCLPAKYEKTGEARPEETRFLTDFQETDRYTLLLCHMPVCWLINESLTEWDVDCVFAGHVHGGEVILPGIGGLYGPDLGWFPGRLWGVYPTEDGTKTLILSRGLGTTEKVPRFHNIPEIVVTDFGPAG